jgi:hypothetical protein
MIVALYIYVDGIARRIELFDDEKISVTSSVQDIADVSKAKTDFTQSFTIPASVTNNEIFKHWYESSIDGGFDHRVKYDGYIEIDMQTFRKGGFALNDVKYKDGMVDSYNIVFFGNAKSIKDLFKEDKLNSLDFSEFNHNYNSTEVLNRIQSTSNSLSVAYPLFAHDRLYDYNNASANDITTNTGAIKWNSLFPAIRLPLIMQLIQAKYGITFTGAFLNYIQFNKLWMLFKNAETLIVPTAPLKVNFTSKTGGTTNELNLTTDEIGFDNVNDSNSRRLNIRITPTLATSVIPYDVLIYKNGVLSNSFTNQLGTTSNTFFAGTVNTQNINDKYTIFVQSQSAITFTSTLFYIEFTFSGDFQANGTSQTTVPNINIGSYAPDLKIIDLFTGLVKMFNLVIIPQDETTFELIPLELYYNNGRYNDISKNVITDDINIKKTSIYKNINFKFEKSENILNNAFNNLFLSTRNFAYGDLKYEQIDSLESSTFSAELPFENPLFERKTNSDFQTVTFKNKDLNNYVPKPVLMYDNGGVTTSPSIKIDRLDGAITSISGYRRFSNDIDNGVLMSLNWGAEISSWFLSNAVNGLYKRHYENYLGNVFNIKSRLLIVKCIFNPVELVNIKLNDKIIIRDKRYTINKMTSDLTTGEVTFELLTDYRVGEVPIGNRYSFEDFYQVDNTAQNFEVMLLMADYDEIVITDSDEPWILVGSDSYFANTTIKAEILQNTSGLDREGNILGVWKKTNGDDVNVKIPIIQNA